MNDRAIVGSARIVVAVGAALLVGGTATVASMGHVATLAWEGGALALLSAVLSFAVWKVAPRRPRNPVVWIMAAVVLGGGLYPAAAMLTLLADPTTFDVDTVPAGTAWVLSVVVALMTVAFLALVTFGLLLFPDGNLPDPRWRWVGILAALSMALVFASTVRGFRPSNPVVPGGGTPGSVGAALGVLAVGLAVAGLVVRMRESEGAVRLQIKWVLWGASVTVLVLAVSGGVSGAGHEQSGLLLFAVGGVPFVASYAVALIRPRLLDVDLVLSRTFVYGALAALIIAFYVAAVVWVGDGLLGIDPETNPWLSIGATAVVAFAFEPMRERLQRLANTLVYGRRATPYDVLSEFSRKIAATDAELLDQVARSLAEGTTARSAAVWVGSDGDLRKAAGWPPDGEHADGETPEGDLVVPIIHAGERLGYLTLEAAQGQELLPTDERLLGQLASGMGLALRNIRLGEDLRRRVDELGRSRRRLVTVQDETRRHLERRLHDGAQQRLVALKVKLALAARGARAAGAGKVADLLDDVVGDTDRVIESLRDFARGVYPPLLEAEGPGSALRSHVQKLPLPVTVHAPGLRRHDSAVESALYFCVLEALQNVVKHARASSAHVAIGESERGLTFEVSDDGSGFDPADTSRGTGLTNLSDRLDVLEGSLEVISSPGNGTTVRGVIPTRRTETVA